MAKLGGVIKKDGNAVNEAVVSIYEDLSGISGDLKGQDTTGADGKYKINMLVSGKSYFLAIEENGVETHRVTFVMGTRSSSENIDLPAVTSTTTSATTSTTSATTGTTTTGTTSATSTTTTGTTTATSVTAVPGDKFSELITLIHKDGDFDLRAPVNIPEAIELRRLYTIGNYILMKIPDSIEILNQVLTSDITGRLNLINKAKLLSDHGATIESILERKADEFNNDVAVLSELRRQFDLGTAAVDTVNIEFKTLFKEYVNLCADELLSVDPLDPNIVGSQFWDTRKIEELYNFLKKLTRVIFSLVANMSEFGTLGTQSLVQKWSDILHDSLSVLTKVGESHIASDDEDEKHIWSIVAGLINVQKSDIEGNIVHAREGAEMLRNAISFYAKIQAEGKLKAAENDNDYLRVLFHEKGDVFKNPDRKTSTVLKENARLVQENWLPNWA